MTPNTVSLEELRHRTKALILDMMSRAPDALDTLATERAAIRSQNDISADYLAGRIVKLLDAYREAAVMAERWRPIDTFPGGRQTVLVQCLVDATLPPYVTAARLTEDDGWWELNNDPTDAWGSRIYPTHWRPMPAPGTVRGEGE